LIYLKRARTTSSRRALPIAGFGMAAQEQFSLIGGSLGLVFVALLSSLFAVAQSPADNRRHGTNLQSLGRRGIAEPNTSGAPTKITQSGTAHESGVLLPREPVSAEIPDKRGDAASLRDFGATGDGTTNDTAAIQAAVNYATSRSPYGGRVSCPAGTYVISATVVIQSVTGLVFTGEGWCRFTWAGNATTPMFDLQDVAFSLFEGLQIYGSASHFLAEGFRLENGPGKRVTPSSNRFVNVYIEGVNGYIGEGLRIYAAGSGGDNNNDFHSFVNVWVSNYSNTAFSLEATQAHYIHFTDTHCQAGSVGQYCVSGGDSSHGAATSFIWEGGFTGSNAKADFLLRCNVARQPYILRGLSSEGSNRFIDSQSACGSYSPLTMDGVRWASNHLSSDGQAIRIEFPGPITIRDSRIGEGYSPAVRIYWSYVKGFSRPLFSMENSTIEGSLSSASAIFPGASPTSLSGVTAQTSDRKTTSLDRLPAPPAP
jgi:hypothetical protein